MSVGYMCLETPVTVYTGTAMKTGVIQGLRINKKSNKKINNKTRKTLSANKKSYDTLCNIQAQQSTTKQTDEFQLISSHNSLLTIIK